jgi:putative addiction module component (TIGR02574 family)
MGNIDSKNEELSEAQRRELERRVADDDANPDEVTPWEQVEVEVRARIT